MSKPLDEIAVILLKAADLIEERGLAKYALEDPEKRLCINGALNLVITSSPDWGDFRQWEGLETSFSQKRKPHDPEPNFGLAFLAACRVSKLIGKMPAYVAQWNNHPDRTKEEVVDILRRAAMERVTA